MAKIKPNSMDDPQGEESPQLKQLREELASLGSETDAQRRAKKVVPWIASVAVHGLMILLGFLITWTAVLLQPPQEPTIIVADFNALSYEPINLLQLDQDELQEEMVQDRIEIDSNDQLINDRLNELEVDPLSLISDAASESPLAKFAPQPTSGRAEFVGLSSSNARRIVYVIDASGSMIRTLPIVIQELGRSLDNLTREQSFSVIFFQRDEALVVPPEGQLINALHEEKIRVLEWIDENIIPVGTSNPLKALEKALGFEPDAVFLLSENITGGGQWEIDQRDLLALLERLNPIDANLGRRPTVINCIQFLDPDPLDTLKKIAQIHGGPKGYKFLDRQELGLAVPR
ncbi:MAG: hypothetical protein O7G85_09550, partial [Planctomycetota bacterium]|nr:hypothetical protein [Planctomycetota bacterium]